MNSSLNDSDQQVVAKLAEMPDLKYEVHEFRGFVETLDIIGNEWLEELPDWIRVLENLSYLQVIDNGLKVFPEWVCDIEKLTVLNLSGNSIPHIPPCVGKLQSMKIFAICNNPLDQVPQEIQNMPLLEDLRLGGLKCPLPSWLGALENLKELNISENSLGELPDWVRKLSNLEKLNASKNGFKTLPEWILELKNLRSLYLSYQKIRIDKELIDTLIERGCTIYLAYADSQTDKYLKECKREYSKRQRIQNPPNPISDETIITRLDEDKTLEELITAINISTVTDARFLQLKLRAMERQGLITQSCRNGIKLFKKTK